ncbi:MAG: hypothetical protein HY292_28775 [Planctomycetes bacterium]|nr:hypothetical protein [Planctomycetota bacterium]
MTGGGALETRLVRIERRALVVGTAGIGLSIVGVLLAPAPFFRAYLVGYLFWLGVSVGCLAILMLQHLVGGSWGLVTRRMLESGARTLPLMALLFLPLLFGIRDLYVWARPEAVAGNPLLQHKAPYLNVPFFVVRAIVYFTVWIGVATRLDHWSAAEDASPSLPVGRHVRRLSAPGLVLYGLTMSFAAIDWVMSLEPRWFSTVFGVLFVVGQGLGSVAFVIGVAAVLANDPPLSDVIRSSHFHDLGNLLLMFVMLWAYIAFSQFLIIWIADLPGEIPWYLSRARGGWRWIAGALLLFYFAVPFILLLNRGAKRRIGVLASIAGVLLLLRWVDLFWMIAPALDDAGPRLHWLDGVVPVAIGGLWIALYTRRLRGRPILPPNDSRLAEARARVAGA